MEADADGELLYHAEPKPPVTVIVWFGESTGSGAYVSQIDAEFVPESVHGVHIVVELDG